MIVTITLMIAATVACTVPGVCLLFRRQMMLTDAISHVLMFGIAVAYWLVRDLDSPWLWLGATAAGLLAAFLIQTLQKSGRVTDDSATGLVFPLLFSLGTILCSIKFRGTHLDVDSVLLGQAEFAGWDRVRIIAALAGGWLLLYGLVHRMLNVTLFDPALAQLYGFGPSIIQYGIVIATTLSAVACFDAVGPVLVVALFAVPAAMGFLLARSLRMMLCLSLILGLLGATIGTVLAFRWDTSTAGTVASVLGLELGIVVFVTQFYKPSTLRSIFLASNSTRKSVLTETS
ncbi:MAG: metal ABC transporter permease, partial [Gemmataceae bacterium]